MSHPGDHRASARVFKRSESRPAVGFLPWAGKRKVTPPSWNLFLAALMTTDKRRPLPAELLPALPPPQAAEGGGSNRLPFPVLTFWLSPPGEQGQGAHLGPAGPRRPGTRLGQSQGEPPVSAGRQRRSLRSRLWWFCFVVSMVASRRTAPTPAGRRRSAGGSRDVAPPSSVAASSLVNHLLLS